MAYVVFPCSPYCLRFFPHLAETNGASFDLPEVEAESVVGY
jgi:hypothetical protein